MISHLWDLLCGIALGVFLHSIWTIWKSEYRDHLKEKG
jgi:hypothetical protein